MPKTYQKEAIPYKCAFDKAELQHVTLRQEFDDGTPRKKSVPVFDGTGGIECLFYCEEQFRKQARRLELEGEELFTSFEECLDGTGEDDWLGVLADLDMEEEEGEERTADQFDEAMQAFYL